MFLHNLEIKQFRCFNNKNFQFNKQFSIIIGDNGSGKTSLAEAIHYLCYMKSFRCSTVSDLICHNFDSFFLKGNFTTIEKNSDDLIHSIQVGYTDKKKVIKLDDKVVTTYKEIFNLFQVITLLEDDIYLVRGNPLARRTFIDQAALFINPSYLDTYRKFKNIIQNRNALLHSQNIDMLEFDIWTEKLWESSLIVQKCRKDVLSTIQKTINSIIGRYFENIYEVIIDYESSYIVPDECYVDFKRKISALFMQERVLKRSVFGAHLDDFKISIKGQDARFFASRGQQKLISLLFKLSLIELTSNSSFRPIIIIDDFIADFDQIRLKNIMNFFISCKNQIIITIPFYDTELHKIIGFVDPEIILIS